MADKKTFQETEKLIADIDGSLDVMRISEDDGSGSFKVRMQTIADWILAQASPPGASTFSALTDAYNLATAAAYTVPMRDGSGNLFAANIFDSLPISVDLATTAALSGYTYNNGTAGVGATLTKSSNGAFPTVDGVAPATNKRYLVKNQTGANRVHNGVYILTQVGGAGTPWILTRTTDSDESTEFDGQNVIASAGTANKGLIFRQTTATPTVGTSQIIYQTNAIAAPSPAPTAITVAQAQALVTAGTVVIGKLYVVTDSSQRVNPNDRIWIRGATSGAFEQVAMYIDSVNNQRNEVIYVLDDVPTDYIIYRRDNLGNELWDIGNYGTILSFPWGVGNVNSNKVMGGFAALSWTNGSSLFNNLFHDQCNVFDGGFNTGVGVGANYVGFGSTIIIGANNALCTSNKISQNCSLTVSKKIDDCVIGESCVIDDGGFNLIGCRFPPGTNFTATKDYVNVDFYNELDIINPSTNDETIIRAVKFSLSAADITTLDSVPITVVNSPGLGYFIEVLSATANLRFVGTSFDNDDLMLKIKTADGAQFIARNILQATANQKMMFTPIGTLPPDTITMVDDQPLEIHADVDATMGDGRVDLYVLYRIVKT